MKNLIRSYHTFLPGNYRWVKDLLYLLYPVCGIFGGLLFLRVFGEEDFLIVESMMVGCGILYFELLFDYFVFGGIASKEKDRLEYLKTSVEGKDVLRKGLFMDAIRRFISAFVILCGAYFSGTCIGKDQGDGEFGLRQIFVTVLLIFLLQEIAFCITRIFEQIWVRILVIQVIVTPFMMLYFTIMDLFFFIPEMIVLVILSAAFLWLHIKQVFRRWKLSYQD